MKAYNTRVAIAVAMSLGSFCTGAHAAGAEAPAVPAASADVPAPQDWFVKYLNK